MAKSPKWFSTLSRVEFSFTGHGITVSKGLLEAFYPNRLPLGNVSLIYDGGPE
jgi:hypothetical protein